MSREQAKKVLQIEADAIAACQDSGSDCVIFAINRSSQIPYRTPQ